MDVCTAPLAWRLYRSEHTLPTTTFLVSIVGTYWYGSPQCLNAKILQSRLLLSDFLEREKWLWDEAS